ncbi:hypothetical protein JMN32_15170 [Fulvivirga sp. 29W222]|uniref:PA14 domain-containing protein n=1 Tax=Fulvivirga marina TaxID=2494733 RepID=A0A937FZD7_9BACT|nr:neuraminidase-like domain-containing protein [Fulvivirga marina]MBL6447657.1 hypothetical protein [Fulvivirga marina]
MATFKLKGQVIDQKSQKIIKNVTVTLLVTQLGKKVPKQSAKVGNDGFFKLSFHDEFIPNGTKATFEVKDNKGKILPNRYVHPLKSSNRFVSIKIPVSREAKPKEVFTIGLQVKSEFSLDFKLLRAECRNVVGQNTYPIQANKISEKGIATFQFTREDLNNNGESPQLYFRIYDEDTLFYDGLEEGEAYNNVPPGKHTYEVALKEKDEIEEFTVSGHVLNLENSSKSEVTVHVYDIDLLGAAHYKSVQTVKELKGTQGIEFLGTSSIDDNGEYEVSFSSEAFKANERGKADVVAFAIRKNEIVGRSRLAFKREYSSENKINNLNIALSEPDQTLSEYDQIYPAAKSFVEEAKLKLSDIAASEEQLKLVAEEIEWPVAYVTILATGASLLAESQNDSLFQGFMYALGRKQVTLTWFNLAKTPRIHLKQALSKAMKEQIIKEYKEETLEIFLTALEKVATEFALDRPPSENQVPAREFLNLALPNQTESHNQLLNAYANHQGNAIEFWQDVVPKLPAFENNPEAVSQLRLTNELSLLSENNFTLVKKLQKDQGITHPREIIYRPEELKAAVESTEIPPHIPGKNKKEKQANYLSRITHALQASYPTDTVAHNIQKGTFPSNGMQENLSAFFDEAIPNGFDLRKSRVEDYEDLFRKVDPDRVTELKEETNKLKRLLQLCPDPQSMAVLLERNIGNAKQIASIPKDIFLQEYGKKLETKQALIIHGRAKNIVLQNELHLINFHEISNHYSPALIGGAIKKTGGSTEDESVREAIEEVLPDWRNLIGPVDFCECKHCRSVLSPAAYLVDLMHSYLNMEGSKVNSSNETPLDVLLKRRPDLAHLHLTCENTNTIIPYIDLANEVMEFYVAHDELNAETAKNIDDISTEELQATPQFTISEAYRKLAKSIYPLSLPYHQPLDTIRIYLNHLKSSRCELINTLNPEIHSESGVINKTIECLGLNPISYHIIAGNEIQLEEGGESIPLQNFYGYNTETSDWKDSLIYVPELLKRTNLDYKDVLTLLDTHYINPKATAFNYLNKLLLHSDLPEKDLYDKLNEIAAGTLDPTTDPDLQEVIPESVLSGFQPWVSENFPGIKNVITLHAPDSDEEGNPISECSLENTRLRSLQDIYEAENIKIPDSPFSKLHRFVRLYPKLGWSITELDLVLKELHADDINAGVLEQIHHIQQVKHKLNVPITSLITLWGNIESRGEKALYGKLFLNKALQEIDSIYLPDPLGRFLDEKPVESSLPEEESPSLLITDHKPSLLAAFSLEDSELSQILQTEELDEEDSILTIPNLSRIYRHVVLARALKLSIEEIAVLLAIIRSDSSLADRFTPFSLWHEPTGEFGEQNPAQTLAFIELVDNIKKAGASISELQYLILNLEQEDQKLSVDVGQIQKALLGIRSSFISIEEQHTFLDPVDEETLREKLGLIYEPDIIDQIIDLAKGNLNFRTTASSGLDITIPDTAADIKEKTTYLRDSGQLVFRGMMTAAERDYLRSIDGGVIADATNALYQQPRQFIKDILYGIFPNDTLQNEAYESLRDRPLEGEQENNRTNFKYIHSYLLPIIKTTLQSDSLLASLSKLTSLDEVRLNELAGGELNYWAEKLSQFGLKATYLHSGTTSTQIDPTIDFHWDSDIPDEISWKGWIRVPNNEKFTFIIDVEQDAETFTLWLNDTALASRSASDNTKIEVTSSDLKAGELYPIHLSYQSNGIESGGINLSWKSSSIPKELIHAQFLFSEHESFGEAVDGWNKARIISDRFALSAIEINYIKNNNLDFAGLDFFNPTIDSWISLHNYSYLKNRLITDTNSLVEFFAQAQLPESTVDELYAKLANMFTGKSEHFRAMAEHLSYSPSDLITPSHLKQIHEAVQLIRKLGISASTAISWCPVEDDITHWDENFNQLNEVALSIKNTVKSKYKEQTWLQVAPAISDVLRENQKQALIQYLLVHPTLRLWDNGRIQDANGLFEYFLLDVQMDACMDTSRIKQAISSVQLFINRCFLNLESHQDEDGRETGVSPDYLSGPEWKWMKNYRVWEANRKVLLYAENWALPELRLNKSAAYKAAESFLAKNDITPDNVETAFRNYLFDLAEVAKLDICGYYEDNDENIAHIFGRTSSTPYKYYYQRYKIDTETWSPWEPVDINIQGVEDHENGGENSGIHLLPVVWKGRLFLFWPIFEETQIKKDNNRSIYNASRTNIENLEPDIFWKIKLVYSEYKNGLWSASHELSPAMKVSEEDLDTSLFKKFFKPEDFLFKVEKNGESLQIKKFSNRYNRSYKTIDLFERLIEALLNSPTIREIHKENLRKELETLNSHSSELNRLVLGEFEINSIYENPTVLLNDREEHHYANFLNSYNKIKEVEEEFYLDNSKILEDVKSSFHTLFSSDVLLKPESIGYSQTNKKSFFYQDTAHAYYVTPHNYFVNLDESIDPEYARPIIPFLEHHNGFDINNIRENNRSIATEARLDTMTLNGNNAGRLANGKARKNGITTKVAGAFAQTHKKSSPWINITSLQFHTFYHPFADEFLATMNRKGIQELLALDLEIESDDGHEFKSHHNPTNSVRKSKFLPEEKIDFDATGAYSLYNWELFFHLPLHIAGQLSKNSKYAEAMKWFHYIFNPTTDEATTSPEYPAERYWKCKPFKKELENIREYLNSIGKKNTLLDEWRNNPFRPHLIAQMLPNKYKKLTVMKYLDNTIAWADSLFRQDTIESINEATQLYIIASHILGPKPQEIPARGTIRPETYHSLKNRLDGFSNAEVILEHTFPYSGDISVPSVDDSPGSLLGASATKYFGIPSNDKLLEYWEVIEDRLFKIRHCMNIEGIERQLALFQPPIDPALLVQATAQGLSLGSILGDLNAPLPHYRFQYIFNKAIEQCQECRSLGGTLLSAIEKRDSEDIAQIRATHEVTMLNEIKLVREQQLGEAKLAKESLLKNRETLVSNFVYYQTLLGIEEPQEPEIGEAITELEVDVDVSLADSDTTGVKLIPKELQELTKANDANNLRLTASVIKNSANLAHLIPNASVNVEPFGIGATITYGGSNLGTALTSMAERFDIMASHLSFESSQASRMASHIRREQEWTHQANQLIKEISRLDSDITAADIRIHIAENELSNHENQISRAKEVEEYLKNKFTNVELYAWMKDQLFSVYKQFYQLSYELAKKAEKLYRLELGESASNFIRFGYWESNKEGLMAGEQLHLALRQMERSFMDKNKRQLEMTKHISIRQLTPQALLDLKATGSATINLPEWLFDLDTPGQYMRRIKSIAVSIPCISGPYTSINCSLTLQSSSVRISSIVGDNYGRQPEDSRFVDYSGEVQSIVTSSGQNDSGMFEVNLNDQRFLPFEKAGVISSWRLDLPSEIRQFNYDTISDVILHIRYTAKQGGTKLSDGSTKFIKDEVINKIGTFTRLFSLKHDFPNEWHQFSIGDSNNFTAKFSRNRLDYLSQQMAIAEISIQIVEMQQGDLILLGTIKAGNLSDLTNSLNSDAQEGILTIDLSELDGHENVYMLFSYRLNGALSHED